MAETWRGTPSGEHSFPICLQSLRPWPVLLTCRDGARVARADGMSWTWRRRQPFGRRHWDLLLDLVLVVLGTVLLVEVLLLLGLSAR
jgi:hypothetical protein